MSSARSVASRENRGEAERCPPPEAGARGGDLAAGVGGTMLAAGRAAGAAAAAAEEEAAAGAALGLVPAEHGDVDDVDDERLARAPYLEAAVGVGARWGHVGAEAAAVMPRGSLC